MEAIYIISAIIGAAAPLLTGLIWLIRLGGRIDTEAALRQALEHRINGFESRIYEALERIENKLDRKADKE